MDSLKTYWENVKGFGIWYRRYMYYYFSFSRHELRLPSPSQHVSIKMQALKSNDLEAIQKALFDGKWKVDDIASINNMTTMLHEAVVMDRRDIASFLLRQGANPNIRDRNGMTPLLKAAALGREYMIIELIRAGADLEHKNPNGFTPLEKAELHEEWKTAELLKSVKSYVKTQSTWKWPPDI